MTEVVECDLSQIVLSDSSFGPQEIRTISEAVSSDFTNYRALRDGVAELEVREPQTPATSVRLGVCYYLIGRYQAALDTLTQGDGGALTQFYMGKANFALGNYAKSHDYYIAAAAAGYGADACALYVAEALRYSGKPEESLEKLNSLSGAVEQTAEYLYQRAATVNVLGGNPDEVVALLERAVANQPNHAGALFGLAMENDRRGNDDTARNLYERSVSRFPSHVGALLNLGILYEDSERFDRAASCYQRILDVYPTHSRARLYLKDAQASGSMRFGEEGRHGAMAHILDISVTDFELSVRSRNCLQRMGINTLGDLARTTEHELLTSKNFGETSLVEIREVLSAKGLTLGELADEKQEVPAFEPVNLSDDEREMHDRSIAEMNLSVRARKCMVRLGISTMGELLRRTGDELLECKNFGVTSLNEVREKLGPMGLRLRGD